MPRRTPSQGEPKLDVAQRQALAAEVLQRVVAQYGHAHFSKKDPLSMLIDILLSHRTRDAQTSAAYHALQDRFVTWEALRDAPPADVEATIAMVNWPEQKAPRIQAILRQITEERGALNLDFLCDLTLDEATAWLGRLHGVGPKTVACVLLFSCRQPILPVDTHVHRVSGRLGLIGPRVSADRSQPLLQALLPVDAQEIYDFHYGLLRHG